MSYPQVFVHLVASANYRVNALEDGASFFHRDASHQYPISTSPKQLLFDQSIVYCPTPQPLSFLLVFCQAPYFEVNHKRSVLVEIHHIDIRGIRLVIGQGGSVVN
jgi:hypothetical protein